MKKNLTAIGTASLLVCAIALAACDPGSYRQEQEKVESQLPEGCKLIYIEEGFRAVDHIVAVVCDGRKTTSLNWNERHGKSHYSQASFIIE